MPPTPMKGGDSSSSNWHPPLFWGGRVRAGHRRGRSKQPLTAPLPCPFPCGWVNNLRRGLGAEILGQRKEGLEAWISGSKGEDCRPMRWKTGGNRVMHLLNA